MLWVSPSVGVGLRQVPVLQKPAILDEHALGTGLQERMAVGKLAEAEGDLGNEPGALLGHPGDRVRAVRQELC